MNFSSPHLSLQRRVTIALVTLVSLFVVVQGTLAYLSLEEQEDELVDELVLTEARREGGQQFFSGTQRQGVGRRKAVGP